MLKFQITNSKFQIISNYQNSNDQNRFDPLTIRIWNLFGIWCLGFGICLYLASCFLVIPEVWAEEVTKIIAKVNNQVITSKDLEDYCKSLNFRLSDQQKEPVKIDDKFKKEALRRLIEDKLILDLAKKEDIKISEQLIEAKIGQMVSSYESKEKFEKDLVNNGLNISILREKIREQHLMREVIDKYVRSQVNIAPSKISDYYNNNKDKFYSSIEYVFYMAQSSDDSTLKEISKVIKKEGILAAQDKYSDILMKVESAKEELREDITNFIENLSSQEHGIQKIDNSFYLIYLEKIIQPRLLSLEEVKEDIYEFLWQIEFRKIFNDWVDKLKSKAVIKNYYE
jgi:peptidyl-prolyl cis-trans isomerase SurA